MIHTVHETSIWQRSGVMMCREPAVSLLAAVEKLAPKWVVVSLSNHQELFVHSHN